MAFRKRMGRQFEFATAFFNRMGNYLVFTAFQKKVETTVFLARLAVNRAGPRHAVDQLQARSLMTGYRYGITTKAGNAQYSVMLACGGKVVFAKRCSSGSSGNRGEEEGKK